MGKINHQKAKISLIGAGSWGTALSILLYQNGHQVRLWDFLKDHLAKIKEELENKRCLPGVPLPKDISFTFDLNQAIEEGEYIIFAIPSHFLRDTLRKIKSCREDKKIISVIKGIENDTFLRPSQIIEEVLPQFKEKVVVFSGPSHAEEVSRNIPTSVVVSSSKTEDAEEIQRLFISPYFRVYTSKDLVGVELGGALKNVIAIAVGICDGLGLGDNTKAALITRGLAEITRLGVALGANAHTFAGLSGMGDLIVTCLSKHSRNRLFGELIGKGNSLEEALSKMTMVAEGVKTAKSVYELAFQTKIELPICEQVFYILYQGKDPKTTVRELMLRDPKAELERDRG
ncbi:NAD(P)H-dependent glycerol-3-phosphate dehydrogenase [bacterium]|nr:NAD(P)H-dependent glycerol-3-phosphate dehydrogenase [bacterium]MBU0899530.1 NAD(P)H-dependent glycerol-3-phosphate dehydrogenase [bacterium]MBU1152732.1 NAD(P)H-dependent glycerol-3-phosphate dehydrogenase [bacterium]MBU2599537.1 NAD(P)H-dependent glycerol-3-phosphate dehydrogenase [bacterium]